MNYELFQYTFYAYQNKCILINKFYCTIIYYLLLIYGPIFSVTLLCGTSTGKIVHKIKK